ncbi:glycosyltransferase family 2 protein [Streptomyces sp. NPDC060184]|uniref:glycosyltransferase family 2 protein n=1 Tax=Streptomyces sp. NPDC060184 TaxID=3347064 RepID=UPI00364B35F8
MDHRTAHRRAPRVTVVCPTYNRSEAITRTIDSVRAQTVEEWELLVVSDGSDDDTEAWVARAAREDPRVRLVALSRTGHPSGPRNAGLAEARGAYTAYLDHDDTWHPHHLRTVLELLEGGADLAASGCEYRDATGGVAAGLPPLSCCWHPQLQLMGPMFEPSRVAHRSGIVEAVGGWRTGAGLEDWDLWLRLADAGRTFATALEPTAVLLTDGGTRRHRMARPHRMPLVHLDDARAAHALLGELRAGSHDETFRASCREDMREWYAGMVRDGGLVRPVDWHGDLGDEIDRVVGGTGRLFEELVLVPDRGRFALARNLLCARPEHARRATALLPAVQPRQLRLLNGLAERAGRAGQAGQAERSGRAGRTEPTAGRVEGAVRQGV